MISTQFSSSATVTSTQTSTSVTVTSTRTATEATVTSTQAATAATVTLTQDATSVTVTSTQDAVSDDVISSKTATLATVTSPQNSKSAILTSTQTSSSAIETSTQTSTLASVSQSTTVISTKMPQPTTVTSSQVSFPVTATFRGKVSSDETNYLRASNLMFKVVPKAVRALFDRHHPPGNLKGDLAKQKNTLKSCKGITKEQFSLLFPSGAGTVTSADFDITFLMALLRNFTGVNQPVTGWNNNPHPSDESEGADIVRIRLCRNKLAHTNDAKLSYTDYQQMWTDVKAAVSRIALAVYDKEVQELETKSLDQRIPPHIEDQHKGAVERWCNEDKVYFETTAYQSAIMCARSHSFLTLVGGPGTGKTATMRHIALLLETEGYVITPIPGIQVVIQYGQVDLKQLFLIDDVLGIFGLQMDKYNKVIDYEEQIFNLLGKSSKLMMTCRKSVYHEAMKYKSFVTKPENVIDLDGENNQLTDEEKKSICKSHCTYAGVQKKVYESFRFDFSTAMFPLLCKVFASDVKYHEIGTNFFRRPYKYISKEFDRLQAHNPLHYAALVMCALNQNKLSEDELDKSELANLKTDVLKRCEVKSTTETWEIVRALSREKGTYTTQLDNEFTLVHDFIFEVIACHYGRQNPDQIMKYMSSSFICEKVSVSKQDVSDEDLKINIQEKHYQLLAGRLYKDICDMNLHDVFMNKCLYDEKFCEYFIQLLECKSYQEIKSMLICKREDDMKIVSKGESVSEKSCDRERWFERKKQVLLVDRRYDIHVNMYLNSVRVVSWIALYGHPRILRYIVNRVTNSKESVELVFGCTTEEQTRLLVLGCCNGDEDLVEIIIKHVSPVSLHQTPEYNGDHDHHLYECLISHRYYTPLSAACRSGHLNIVTKLIKYQCDINKGGNYGNTPLTAACEGGHLNIVKKLIEYGCDINKAGNYKNTPLTAACEGGHLNIVDKLIESGCDINKAGNYGNTPLTAACEGGYLNIVNRLIECRCDINKAGNYRNTLLTAACEGGNTNIANTLIETGCDLIKAGNFGKSPLTAACEGGHLKTVNRLIESGSDINKAGNYGKSPLTAACKGGHLNIVNRLIEAGCDIDKAGRYGNTPLTAGCEGGHLNIVNKLITCGCDVNKVGRYGNTPMTAACEGGHLNIVKRLIESRCDLDKTDNNKNTALTVACEGGHLNIVNSLIESGCDVNKADSDRDTPLSVACESGRLNIVNRLIESGCDVNKTDSSGNTPLSVACKGGYLNIVNRLIESGCDINKPDKHGNTPLKAACDSGHLNIVNKLIECGCDINKDCKYGEPH